MGSELRKVSRPRTLLVLALLVLLNLAFLGLEVREAQAPGGLGAMRGAFRPREELEKELEEVNAGLEELLWGEGQWDEARYDALAARREVGEMVLQRTEQAEDYPLYREGLVRQAEQKAASGLFGDEDSFALRSLRRTAERFRGLEGVEPAAGYHGGLELLLGWRLTDLFFFCALLLGSLELFTRERGSGMLALLRPLAGGGRALFCRKAGAMGLWLLAAFLLFYGPDLLLCGGVLGFGDLDHWAQGIWGLQNCPFRVSAGGYLLLWLGLKLLWGLAVGSLLLLLSGLTGRPQTVLLLAGGLALLSWGLAETPWLWGRTLSLLWLSDPNRLLAGWNDLDCFGWPLGQLPAALIWWGAVTLLSLLAAGRYHCKASALPVHPRRRRGRGPGRGGDHASLFRHEGYKLLVAQRGGLVLFLLLALTLLLQSPVEVSAAEAVYRDCSLFLAGPPSQEKEDWLAREEERYQALQQELEGYQSALEEGQTLEYLTQSLRSQLLAREGFTAAKNQYIHLSPGMEYVYATPWEQLFGPAGGRTALREYVLLLAALALALGGLHPRERETGVLTLQEVTGGRGRSDRYKALWAGLCLLPALLAAFLPRQMAVIGALGLEGLAAPAASLTLFAALPAWFPLGGVLALCWLVRLGVGLLWCGCVLAITRPPISH